jgi:hypothetical protein
MAIKPRQRKIAWIIMGIVILIIALRLALPYIVLHYTNKSLAKMNGYYGHVEDIDIALIRGAYRVDSIYLNKSDTVSGKQTPFFAASAIDLSIEWKALFKGSIVGEVVFEKPTVLFTKDKVEPADIAKDSADFKKVLDDFMPLSINRCEIRQGTLRYVDQTTIPKVDLQMDQLHVLAQNLRNSYDSTALLPASLDASANLYEGKLTMNARLNPLADKPTFDMSAELKNTNLVKLNDFFQAYAKIDVNKGSFGLYTEVAAKDNHFAGYVKPLMNDLDILGKEDRKDNLFQKLWEAVAGGVGQLLRNHPKDQVATKIPFQGRLDDPKTNIWYALSHILQNAFIQAIQPSIDNEISIASVAKENGEKKTFLQKIFSKDKKEKDDKKEKK